jgi:hypothetical protein
MCPGQSDGADVHVGLNLQLAPLHSPHCLYPSATAAAAAAAAAGC